MKTLSPRSVVQSSTLSLDSSPSTRRILRVSSTSSPFRGSSLSSSTTSSHESTYVPYSTSKSALIDDVYRPTALCGATSSSSS